MGVLAQTRIIRNQKGSQSQFHLETSLHLNLLTQHLFYKTYGVSTYQIIASCACSMCLCVCMLYFLFVSEKQVFWHIPMMPERMILRNCEAILFQWVNGCVSCYRFWCKNFTKFISWLGILTETKRTKGKQLWLGKTGFSKKKASRKLQRSWKWFDFYFCSTYHILLICLDTNCFWPGILCAFWSQKAKNNSSDGHSRAT